MITPDKGIVVPRLTIPRYFTSENQHPFDAVGWDVRDAVITGKDGKSVFDMRGVEFPDFWSQRATNIVASKYFRVVNGERETSVRHMLSRVVDAIGQWGHQDNYFADRVGYRTSDQTVFCTELMHILLNQYAAFNSPVWFNVGVATHPQTSACFILDVEDSIESILEWYRQEGIIFKGGSGSGVNLSKIRAKGSPLSNGGVASGVMSFARVADANAGAIKSGGSTRRAAKLLVLNVDHPEIKDFIQSKCDAEKLAQKLMELGYGNGIEGGAYDQVPWQNANNSVRVNNHFMDDALCSIGLVVDGCTAPELLHKIVKAAYECGCPGLLFSDTINAWHTTPGRGPIVSANPCGEFLRPPNEACNLASLNLLKFLENDGSFDIPAFTHTVDIMITAMDILIDRSSYPTETIAQNSQDYRPLGLGYTNLGALLMAKGIPYDSDEGRAYAASVTGLLTGEAYTQSSRIAEVKGTIKDYTKHGDGESMHAIIGKHRHYAYNHSDESPIALAAMCAWDEAYTRGGFFGYRNCQVSVLAPCGTISFMMDSDTTGIEPCLGLVTTKKLVGGGEIRLVNGVVDRALQSLGFAQEDERRALREAILEKMPDRLFDHRDVFATALGDNTISWQGHIKMVAAVQPFISGGISKTINMPHEATVQDVYDAYVMAWKLGLKAISIYRDGSKGIQPATVLRSESNDLIAVTEKAKAYVSQQTHHDVFMESARKIEVLLKDALVSSGPQRRRLPDERLSITHKFTINTYEGYLTVGLFDDGCPGELFVRMSKEGSTLGGLMDAWATVVSITLQYGVPLAVLVAKFKNGQYEPRGFTGNPEIHTASSITDYIVRWMELKFIDNEQRNESQSNIQPGLASVQMSGANLKAFIEASSFPLCSKCGNMTIHNGSCCVCTVCGTTTGCS